MLEFDKNETATDALRATFRRHASGVSVITCTDPGATRLALRPRR